MIQVNLLPWRETLRASYRRQFFIEMGLAAGVALFGLLIFHLYVYHQRALQQSRNDFLQQEIDQINLKMAKYRGIAAKKKELMERFQTLAGIYNQRFQAVRLLDELPRELPREVYITKIEYKNGAITLNGEAQNNAQVTQFMENVNQSSYFTHPSLSEIVSATEEKKYKRNFQIIFKFAEQA